VSIFGPKIKEVAREWRRFHNKELQNLYASPNIYCLGDKVKENEMGRICSTYESDEK
jgi:hypothetical protein